MLTGVARPSPPLDHGPGRRGAAVRGGRSRLGVERRDLQPRRTARTIRRHVLSLGLRGPRSNLACAWRRRTRGPGRTVRLGVRRRGEWALDRGSRSRRRVPSLRGLARGRHLLVRLGDEGPRRRLLSRRHRSAGPRVVLRRARGATGQVVCPELGASHPACRRKPAAAARRPDRSRPQADDVRRALGRAAVGRRGLFDRRRRSLRVSAGNRERRRRAPSPSVSRVDPISPRRDAWPTSSARSITN